ncbi:hypothetical protein Q4589_00205 [Cobetia marina]|uniref:hypothetical protein n=1 Tax=Cobetia TaxID=204286 RepID=UPI0006CA03EA|nr:MULTISPECIES: hypothetical protein [Cobetia]AOM00840.1 hypothetical protein BFX80_05460 [Cobetia marina]KPM81858.1 hypothetical protein AOG28_00020 [Cobetia sp. UCD-24C]MDO6786001.1 hypothetical protein [Cobetia marina]
MTRDQLMESLLHLPHPWPRPETECSLPTDNGHGDLEGWIKGPTNNEWHYAWIGAHERRIVITREQWEEVLLARVERLEQQAGDEAGLKQPDAVDPNEWHGDDDLPPIGAAVSFDTPDGDIAVATVIGHALVGANIVIESAGRGVEVRHCSELSPARSDREKAIESMKQITKAAADAHKRELHGALSEEYLLGALYDAGHRKVKS